LDKNNGYNTILQISKILTGPERLMEGLSDELTAGDDIT